MPVVILTDSKLHVPLTHKIESTKGEATNQYLVRQQELITILRTLDTDHLVLNGDPEVCQNSNHSDSNFFFYSERNARMGRRGQQGKHAVTAVKSLHLFFSSQYGASLLCFTLLLLLLRRLKDNSNGSIKHSLHILQRSRESMATGALFLNVR